MSHQPLGISRFVVLVAVCVALTIPAFADSQARIVRLSTVEGDVQIDRNVGSGFEKAMVNLPITEGVKLRSQHDGRAEVEFEDGSTLRIVNGWVEFPQLSLRESGDKVTSVKVMLGTAYVDFAGKKDNEFTLSFGHESARLTDSVRLRLEVDTANAVLSVFKGEMAVTAPSGNVELKKKQSASFDFANNDSSTIAKRVEQGPFDEWDKHQDKYHDSYMANSSYNSPYAYGRSDLNYYGNFFDAPGYGMVWQPYFVGAGWDPFMNGAWAWYPGAGYTWVSAYPWGWMPYRYGTWAFLPTYGWVWQPGGFGGGWNRTPRILNAPSQFSIPQAPTGPTRTTMIVNRTSLVAPTAAASNRMVIRNDSAGLGIPRGSIRNPGRVSQEVAQRGTVTTKMSPAPARTTPMSAPTTPTTGATGGRPTSAGSRSSGSVGGNSRVSAPSTMPRSAPSSAPRSAPGPSRSTPR